MKLKALVLMSLVAILVSGCGTTVAPEGDNLLQEGISNLYYDAKSAEFDLSVSIDAKAGEDQVPKNLNFDLKINGDMDNTIPSKPKFNFEVSANGGWDDIKDQVAKAELKSDAENLFFNLTEITDFGGKVPTQMVEAYIGKWYKMAIPEGTFEGLDKKSEMSDEEKMIKELVEKSKFMKDVKYNGTKKIMGVESYDYSATLDKEALKNFAVELAKLDTATPDLTEAQIASMDEQLAMFDLNGNFYVGVDDKILRGASGVLTVKNEDVELSADFSWELGKINEEFAVEVPEDATLFDPMMLFGGAAMMDPSMYEMDPSMYEDMNMEEFDMGDLSEMSVEE
jgi:hypothetical protein